MTTMVDRVAVRDQTTALLTTLGPTSTAVARTLAKACVVGVRGDGRRDPVATWLTRRGVPGEVYVSDRIVRVFPPGPPAAPVLVPLPLPVAQFVRLFDAGLYPALDHTQGGGGS